MAIKVSGTEVISNARALTNVASIDATTAASFAAGGVGGNTTYISTTTVSSAATSYTLSLPSGYSSYRFVISNIKSTSSPTPTPFRVYSRLSTDGGSTFYSTSTNYYWVNLYWGVGTSSSYENSGTSGTPTTYFSASKEYGVDYSDVWELFLPAGSNRTWMRQHAVDLIQAEPRGTVASSFFNIVTAPNAIQIFTVYAFASGTIKLYGCK